MADGTSIEWTDATWSPVVGCTRVSKGCDHCYAYALTKRLEAMGQAKYAGLVNPGKGHFNGKVRLHAPDLDKPLRWRRGRRIFVNPMSDLFHEGLSFEEIAAVFAVMALAPRHTFQVLTKRPRRALEFFAWLGERYIEKLETQAIEHFDDEAEAWLHNYVGGWSKPQGLPDDGNPANGTVRRWPLPNVWLGVSVEDQATADERIPLLLQCPAAVRFVSYEPALGPVDFGRLSYEGITAIDALNGLHGWPLPHADGPRLDWIIVGGESGAGRRECDPAWIQSTADQCAAADVPCFVKQDSGAKPGRQGRLSDALWARKEFPA